MDIFVIELAIADATYEATINRIVSMDSIESMYMTEASGDGDNFFKKLIVINLLNYVHPFMDNIFIHI